MGHRRLCEADLWLLYVVVGFNFRDRNLASLFATRSPPTGLWDIDVCARLIVGRYMQLLALTVAICYSISLDWNMGLRRLGEAVLLLDC